MRRPPVRPLIRIRFFKQCGIDRHDAGLQVDLKSSTIEGKFGSQAKFTRVFNSSTAKDDSMARDEDDDDGLPPLGENTDKFLDQAKKGQPRNFLLVCKGNKVTYLAVRKKPVKKNELNEAKKSGYKGEGYFGVITGKGMELVFNLSTADGYTAEPVKDKILKDFLEEKANFKCKPTIAIVATLPDIPFDDEDLSNPLVARFLALGERITQVLDMNPNAEGELKQTTSEIRGLLQDAEFSAAEPRVSALETRLQELLNGAAANSPVPAVPNPPALTATTQPNPPNPPNAPTTPVATPLAATTPAATTPAATPQTATPSTPTVGNEALKLKLQEALNKLVPQLKQAVMTYPEKKVELLTPVAQVKKQMDAGELQEAKQGILAVGQLLKSVMSQSTTTQSTGESQPQVEDPLRLEYERKLAALQPSYKKSLEDKLGDTSKFRTVMAYVLEQAEAGVFANSIKALDRLAIAIEQALSAGVQETGIQTGIVEKRKFLLTRMKEIPIEIRPLFNDLKDAIIEDMADEDPSEITAAFELGLQTLYDELQNEFDKSINAGSTDLLRGLTDRVLKNELVQLLVENPFTDGSEFQSKILDALTEIETKMTSTA